MSILIKGMEMPLNGWKHIMLTSNGKAYRFEEITASTTATMYEAVEVPPHGGLIDADALISVLANSTVKFKTYDDWEHLCDIIRNVYDTVPTVIPADDKE